MQYGEAGVSYVYEFCPYPAPNVDVSQLSVVLTNRKKSSTEGLGRPQVDKGLGRPVKGNNHVVEDQPRTTSIEAGNGWGSEVCSRRGGQGGS